MTPTEGQKLTLRGKEYTLRFTLPRLRELCQRSGGGLYNLRLQATTLNVDSLLLLLWGAIAHPGNDMAKATVDEVAMLIDMNELRPTAVILSDALEELLKPAENPQKPDDQ